MKKIFWLALAALLSTSLMAQTNARPKSATRKNDAAVRSALDAATQAEAAAEAEKKSKATAPAAAEKDAKLVPGPATVSGNNVNVRGRASFTGEIVTRLNKGDAVAVLEEITLAIPRKGEPHRWARVP